MLAGLLEFPVADAPAAVDVRTGVEVSVTPYIEGIGQRKPYEISEYTYHGCTNRLCSADCTRKIAALATGVYAIGDARNKCLVFACA